MREQLRRELERLGQSHPHIAHELRHHFSGGGGGDAADNEDGFIYGAAFGNVAAAGQTSQTVTIDNLSDFRMDQIVGYGEPNGQAAPILSTWIPQLTLNIFDGSQRRSLFSIALPFGAVVGSAQLPFIPAVRRLWARNQSLTLTVTNFGAITYNNVFVGLVGANIYDTPVRK